MHIFTPHPLYVDHKSGHRCTFYYLLERSPFAQCVSVKRALQCANFGSDPRPALLRSVLNNQIRTDTSLHGCAPFYTIPSYSSSWIREAGPAPFITLLDKPTLLLSYIINLALHLGGETPADIWPTAASQISVSPSITSTVYIASAASLSAPFLY